MVLTILNSLGIFIVTVFCVVYLYFKNEHSYWRRRKVPFIPPSFPFGNVSKVILRTDTLIRTMKNFYTDMKSQGHRYVGIYFFSRKALLIIDPEIAKLVLATDFQHFNDRGLYSDEDNDPLSANLVSLSGDKWKRLRSKLTPAFSSGKLKTMFNIVAECANEMVYLLDKEKSVEIKDLVARYTTDVIGSCAFGIDCNSLKNPDAEFRKIGRRMFQEQPIDILRRMCSRSFPSLSRHLRLKVLDTHVSSFFMSAVMETVKHRTDNDIRRADFLQLLIDMMDKERLQETLTLNEAAAQAFVFFLAGFETSASTITFVLYELARNCEIQDTVRREISDCLKKNDGNLDYNSIAEMSYMEKVIQETLRKWPIIPFLMRKCTKTYQIPNTDTIIEKGVSVLIPTCSFHADPEYYPDPEVFDPERFDSDITKKMNDYTYLPFGNGPRICIGLRFAMVQVKVALAMLVKNYEFSVNEKTLDPLVIGKNPMVLTPVGGVWLDAKAVTN